MGLFIWNTIRLYWHNLFAEVLSINISLHNDQIKDILVNTDEQYICSTKPTYLNIPSAKNRLYSHLVTNINIFPNDKCRLLNKGEFFILKFKILNIDIHNERKQLYQKTWAWTIFGTKLLVLIM